MHNLLFNIILLLIYYEYNQLFGCYSKFRLSFSKRLLVEAGRIPVSQLSVFLTGSFTYVQDDALFVIARSEAARLRKKLWHGKHGNLFYKVALLINSLFARL
jgi:hypothetical protein